MLTRQILWLLIITAPIETYINSCPCSPHRVFRSHGVCIGAPENYSCLFDTNKGDFEEYCNIRPDFSAPGEYYVVTGNRRNIECAKTVYQPYSLWSNESSRCTFKKSLCTERGQILYKMGSAVEDIHCRCDYTKRYAFVITPTNRCFCIPSEEDCSCYIKQCGFGSILNADYSCKLHSQMSKATCEATKKLRIDANMTKEDTYIEIMSDQKTVLKSEKDVISTMIFISVVLLMLLVLCFLVLNFGKDKVLMMNQSALCLLARHFRREHVQTMKQSVSSTTLIGKEKDQIVENKTTNVDFAVVAAIDLGSTSSWYASLNTATFKTNPLNILMDSAIGSPYLPTKTATCILLNEDESFNSLGNEAQDKFTELLLDGDASTYFFFYRFKMELYNNENISKDMVIKDIKGRKMKAIDVFSSFINGLMERVNSNPMYKKVEFDDVQWVLTVPAVWSDKAKTFMRHCAEKTGVRGNRLLIASEPEVVSVYFQYLHKYEPKDVPELDKRYLVVDIGGGTVDITVHEKTIDGNLIELCKRAGNDIGGNEVNKNFLVLLTKIVGDKVMHSLSTDDSYMDSYFDILKEIEDFKRSILLSESANKFFRIPVTSLDILCKKYNGISLSETIVTSKYPDTISLKNDHIIFRRSSLLSLFEPVGERISTTIQQVIDDLKDMRINMILLAGGMSMSPAIVRIINESFKNMKIITLPDKYPADLAVVKGAVLYGHQPHFINSRITEFTYGREYQPAYDPQKHDETKLINIHGTDLCKDVFDILVPKNTRVNVDEIIQKEYTTITESQDKIRIAVYITKKDKVDYVDDAECELFCEVMVPLTNSQGQPSCVVVDFIFGLTEFRVTAREKETEFEYKVSVELK